jgi:hypothetical protein
MALLSPLGQLVHDALLKLLLGRHGRDVVGGVAEGGREDVVVDGGERMSWSRSLSIKLRARQGCHNGAIGTLKMAGMYVCTVCSGTESLGAAVIGYT